MKVGSLVECVGVKPKNETQKRDMVTAKSAGYKFPEIGEIYTVRGFNAKGTSIFLEEIVNPPMFIIGRGQMGEAAFLIEGFREIQPPMSLEFIEEMQHPLTLLTQTA